ncbi:hypothetical protein OIU74_020004 [Salix koriyanagi]|uniref:Uncharacterized protein n=1 Tax=Salix koriyanagi TaxID=2511006 RepID=A0A9Q0P519_9ROSI|nr:hypothetical protein OIU74_020004 [Salix koriyanagi]
MLDIKLCYGCHLFCGLENACSNRAVMLAHIKCWALAHTFDALKLLHGMWVDNNRPCECFHESLSTTKAIRSLGGLWCACRFLRCLMNQGPLELGWAHLTNSVGGSSNNTSGSDQIQKLSELGVVPKSTTATLNSRATLNRYRLAGY